MNETILPTQESKDGNNGAPVLEVIEQIKGGEPIKPAIKKHKKRSKGRREQRNDGKSVSTVAARYPRHSLSKCLRIPRGILEQNAGKECTDRQAAAYIGVSYSGEFQLEISSATKFGLLERPSTGNVAISDLAKKILRPQQVQDELNGLRDAVLRAPQISEVYTHYRGENLPDQQFFDNTLVDRFNVPREKVGEFTAIFKETLLKAGLLVEENGKSRIIDAAGNGMVLKNNGDLSRKGDLPIISTNETCFVMMPFESPLGDYYLKIYEPAIKKAGLIPIRADNDIFGTGKIMDQIWSGINSAKILLSELTSRNPNVFYELGLAHALRKPVVLISSNEQDVPFDLHHIRVIYYDVYDPFWGSKLIDKVSENILSALQNPEEAIFTNPQ
ncbi:MAG TPA: hypothetical protein VKS81_05005 [Bacteroidota bacterium]|nr:hypothetical protein [Bacteroidota bacterium]